MRSAVQDRDCGCGVRCARHCVVREERGGLGGERGELELALALCIGEVRKEFRRDVVWEQRRGR